MKVAMQLRGLDESCYAANRGWWMKVAMQRRGLPQEVDASFNLNDGDRTAYQGDDSVSRSLV
jgi:hypothetical protein